MRMLGMLICGILLGWNGPYVIEHAPDLLRSALSCPLVSPERIAGTLPERAP